MTRRNLLAALRAAEAKLAETQQQLAVQTDRATIAVESARDVLAEKQQAEFELMVTHLDLDLANALLVAEQVRRDFLLDAPRCLPVLGERTDGVGPSPIYAGMVAEGWVA